MTALPSYTLALITPMGTKMPTIGYSAPWPVVSSFFKANEKHLLLHIHCKKALTCVWILNMGTASVVLKGTDTESTLLPAASTALSTDEQGHLRLELHGITDEVQLFAAQLPLPEHRSAALWQRLLRKQRLPAAWLQLLKNEQHQWLQNAPHTDARLLEAMRLLETASGNVLSIEQLSKAVGMNSTSLKKAFKAHTGSSIFKYQQLKRLQAAAGALLYGELSLSHIAEQAGYLNQRHFATAFKKEFGASPAEYRLNKQG